MVNNVKKYDKVEILSSNKDWIIGRIGYVINTIGDRYIVQYDDSFDGTDKLKEDCLKKIPTKCYYLVEICSATPNESYRINKLVVSDTPLTREEILGKADCLFTTDVTKIEILNT